MTTPAKMRSAEEWTYDWLHGPGIMLDCIRRIQSDAIAFTEASVRAEVMKECAKVCALLASHQFELGGNMDPVHGYAGDELKHAERRILALAAKPMSP